MGILIDMHSLHSALLSNSQSLLDELLSDPLAMEIVTDTMKTGYPLS